MSCGLLGLGIVAPAAQECGALMDILAGPGSGSFAVSAIPDAADARTRRLPRLERMALAAARQALLPAAPTESLGLVFGTGYGGLGATVDFLEGIATRGPEFGSPTAFHQSVHHSPAGQLSIALGLRGPSLTVSARELSGEMALAVGQNLLATGRAEAVLVVAADERSPALEAAYRSFGASLKAGEGAAAVLISRDGGSLRVDHPTLTAHAVPVLRFPSLKQFAPLMRESLRSSSGQMSFSLAAPNQEIEEAEIAALADCPPVSKRWADTHHFGFHPSGGLLRLVAAALRVGLEPPGAACAVHGLSLGGGQSVTVVHHARS